MRDGNAVDLPRKYDPVVRRVVTELVNGEYPEVNPT
jgi:hypothetical protein